MFVIVTPNGKPDILSEECVCLSGVTEIKLHDDKTRITFNSNTVKSNADLELVASGICFNNISSLEIDFDSKQIIAIMP